ncbi:MAG: hypothetical protein J7M14_02780, partial [Planctomycetes bacterium]|nr:hypothetical protein [Planctomycetota bacterium]
HQKLFEQTDSVCGAILAITDYAAKWLAETIASRRSSAKVFTDETPGPAHTIGHFEVLLEEDAFFEPARIVGSTEDGARQTIYVSAGTKVIGSEVYMDNGSIYIAQGVTIEPGVGIKGPTIIGKNTEIRQGAYLRGGCILGDGCIIRGEIKNTVLMNQANFPHPSYLGDSACGYMTHFGNQATTANIGVMAGLVDPSRQKPLVIQCDGNDYDLGKAKMGMCMGDFSQVGCNSVSDPGTFLKPYTIAYSLTRLSKGIYGPREILKNKPMEHGVIERAPLRSLGIM